MYGLPLSTQVSKQLPKTAIYRKYNVSAKDQTLIDDNISRLDIVCEISGTTTSINAGNNVNSFFIVKAQLKKPDYEVKAIQLLFSLIGQKCILALSYNGETSLACINKRLFVTPWKADDKIELKLSGITLDNAWDGIQAQVMNLEHIEETGLDFQVEKKIKLDDLKAQLEKLKKSEKKEIQPRRKHELHLQVLQLSDEIKKIEI